MKEFFVALLILETGMLGASSPSTSSSSTSSGRSCWSRCTSSSASGAASGALRGDQVRPLHDGRLAADAGRRSSYLYFHHAAAHRHRQGLDYPPIFDVLQCHVIGAVPPAAVLASLAFGLAFAIKVPMFPLHTWLPDAHVEAPTAGSVILAAVLLKFGTYGFIRFALPLFPDAASR